ncbi:B-cell receptor CD22-like [Parambassis ranga]|uniref:B-cell receptor CD22 n=1 Tax=Parambassis ranga TaxID=210632 RepID=A0A6P7I008_9TELE|nr:B-cell receptor CD22-like [Parambassis ranga]
MSPAAAVSGLVFIVSVSVVQSQVGWRVTYTSTEICAVEGSTVEIDCTYTYPHRMNGCHTTVEKAFWFRTQYWEALDLRADSKYAGRVNYHCGDKACTLRITDLRESDSAEYKFRFITNCPDGKYTGSPGVTLSVTGVKVDISRWSEMKCVSSCIPPNSHYTWYKNGKETNDNHYSDYTTKDSVSCAINGYHSPLVCVRGDPCNKVTYTKRSICAFKGSSVDITCMYKGYSIQSKFWFRSNPYSQWDLKTNQYGGHVEVFEPESWTYQRRSTLRIRDLTERDSAEYKFMFTTTNFKWGSSLPGTTLTVTDVQVQVIWSPTGPKLICHSSCLPPGHSSFVWYKNNNMINGETSSSYSKQVDRTDTYSCAFMDHHSAAVYAPMVTLVRTSPSGDIMNGSSVTLTCRSDANPAAKHTWYKGNQTLLCKETQLVFSSIQASDTGNYRCTAENELDGPETPSVSVSPFADIVEGNSVTLTCSGDANPPANYTWYKNEQPLPLGSSRDYHFTSISSEDRGNYSCESQNKYRRSTSTYVFLDVQYVPRLPSVSVSPSAEIVEGQSLTLTCSSNANPAANYTWYKEDEDSPKASGQKFTITETRAEHSGSYYCEAQNSRGRQNSSLHLITVKGVWKSTATGITSVFLLAAIVLTVLLLIRRKQCFKQQHQSGERDTNRAELNISAVHHAQSAAPEKQPTEQQDELLYSTICLYQADPVYSNIPKRAPPCRQTEEEDDVTEYSAVKFDRPSAASRTRCDENEDSCAVYSTVNKK